MSTYIMFINYTDEGFAKVKESPKRLDGAKALMKRFGGEMTQFYLCMGSYDVIAVLEAPDDESVMKFTLAMDALGYVKAVTLRVFTEAEYKGIVSALP